jgi:hypothetical protein
MSDLNWVTVCGGSRDGCGLCKDCRIEELEAELAEFKRRLPDDYLTQLEFARTEHSALMAENDRLRDVLTAIAGGGPNPFIPKDDFAYFEVRDMAVEALAAAQENDDE